MDIYFVQNKISKIEGLEGMDKLTNLELAANRIRVSCSTFQTQGDMDHNLTCTTVQQEIENLETLTSLEQLWLGKNKITELKVGMVHTSSIGLVLTISEPRCAPGTYTSLHPIKSHHFVLVGASIYRLQPY